MDLVGKVLGNRYEIIEKIGSGGMADVYKARCNLLNRYVAIKVLKDEFAQDETFVKRFRAEAQAAASLTHPNIVSVYDVGQENGINYIVMELLESRTLKDYIDEHGALDSDTVLKISAQVASALEAAHKSHIIHRDIKPQNIVLNKNMVAKVTDFGIAKISTAATITSFGNTMGSVHYFSPEHAKGGYTDERSDIYSLGVVMYEMATGRLPFDADSPVSVALKHIQEDPEEPIKVNPNVSLALNNVILKAMQKRPIDRYQSAATMLSDIYVALREPNNKLIAKTNNSVEAGATQVIPIIGMKDIDQNSIPNLRTRQSRRMRVIEDDNQEPVDKINSADTQKNDQESADVSDGSSEDVAKKTNKKKMSKTKITLIVIFSLLFIGIAVYSGIKIYKNVQAEKEANKSITVPDLVGRNFDEVVKEYESQGIKIVKDKDEYSSEQKEGNIISQSIEKGTVTKDKTIYVVVSQGQKMATVTDVTGKDIKVARYELEQTLGFVVEQEDVVSEKVAEGIVISQDHKKDEQIPYGSTIKLQVSKGDGKPRVLMPSVLGKTEEEAKKTLTDLKLVVNNVKYGEDNSQSNGVVIAQSYPQNQTLKEGDTVDITVNRLVVSKKVNIDVPSLLSSAGVKAEEGTKVQIKVDASIDSGVANSIYNQSIDSTQQTITLDIKGYTDAKLQIYVNDKKVNEQTINFKQ